MTTLTDFRRMVTADDRVTWFALADWLYRNGDEHAAWVRRFAEDGVTLATYNGEWSAMLRDYKRYLGDSYETWDAWRNAYHPTPLDALLALADGRLAAEKDRPIIADH